MTRRIRLLAKPTPWTAVPFGGAAAQADPVKDRDSTGTSPDIRRRAGILAHSAEGAALCFLTYCQEGGREIGPHQHESLPSTASLTSPGGV